jgi:hypothetical protein
MPAKRHRPRLNSKLACFKLRIGRSRIGRLESLPLKKIDLFNVLWFIQRNLQRARAC